MHKGDTIVHVDRYAERLVDDLAVVELRTVFGQRHLLHYAWPNHIATAMDDVQKRLS